MCHAKVSPLAPGPGVFTCAENKKTAARFPRATRAWQRGCCPKLAPCPRSGARWVLGASMSVRTFSLSRPLFLYFSYAFFLLLRYLGGGKQVRGLEEKVGCGIFSPGGKISAVLPVPPNSLRDKGQGKSSQTNACSSAGPSALV